MKEPCTTAWFMLFWRKPLTRSSPFVTCIRGLVQWVIWHKFEKVLSFVSNLPKSKGGDHSPINAGDDILKLFGFFLSFQKTAEGQEQEAALDKSIMAAMCRTSGGYGKVPGISFRCTNVLWDVILRHCNNCHTNYVGVRLRPIIGGRRRSGQSLSWI